MKPVEVLREGNGEEPLLRPNEEVDVGMYQGRNEGVRHCAKMRRWKKSKFLVAQGDKLAASARARPPPRSGAGGVSSAITAGLVVPVLRTSMLRFTGREADTGTGMETCIGALPGGSKTPLATPTRGNAMLTIMRCRQQGFLGHDPQTSDDDLRRIQRRQVGQLRESSVGRAAVLAAKRSKSAQEPQGGVAGHHRIPVDDERLRELIFGARMGLNVDRSDPQKRREDFGYAREHPLWCTCRLDRGRGHVSRDPSERSGSAAVGNEAILRNHKEHVALRNEARQGELTRNSSNYSGRYRPCLPVAIPLFRSA